MRIAILLAAPLTTHAAKGNRAERLEWFRDRGFRMFIH